MDQVLSTIFLIQIDGWVYLSFESISRLNVHYCKFSYLDNA